MIILLSSSVCDELL